MGIHRFGFRSMVAYITCDGRDFQCKTNDRYALSFEPLLIDFTFSAEWVRVNSDYVGIAVYNDQVINLFIHIC